MSSIVFNTEDEEVAISGSERAYTDMICADIFLGFMHHRPIKEYAQFLPTNHYARVSGDNKDIISAFGGYTTKVEVAGHVVFPWTLGLNTALHMCTDTVKLLARIHGSCEVHGYVEGPNRTWLAEIISKGTIDHILRPGMGWHNVVTLLQQTDNAPVVLSYSVTDEFPRGSKSWSTAMKDIRKHSDELEFKPENWNTFTFDEGLWIADLYKEIDNSEK